MQDTPPLPARMRAELQLARLARRWRRRSPRALEPAPEQAFERHEIPPADAVPRAPAATGTGGIPRILWTYWNSERPPAMIRACFENWRRHAEGFELRILDDRSLSRWAPERPPGLAGAGAVKTADWLRLELLRRYGGIWLDASSLLTRSPAWALAEQARSGSEFVGYWLKRYTTWPRYPVVENWFMAAPAGSRFVADLQREFTERVVAASNEDYIRHLTAAGLYERVRQGIDIPHYLSMHLAAQVVMQTRGGYRLSLCAAEDGPFFYHQASGWNRNRLRARLLLWRADAPVPALVKLRKPDRRRLDTYLAHGIALPGSFLHRYLPGTDAPD